MGFRFTSITSTLFALAWLTLTACATTPQPPVALPTATTILAYPPPPPPANPNLILTPTSILTVVVFEVHTVDDHLELTIYPSGNHPYSMVELSPGTLVVQAAALAPGGMETQTTFEAIEPNARLGVVGYEQINTETNTVHFVAREVMIMELDASLLTPTPAPQWGEPGYPAPISPPAAEVVAPLPTPTMALPPLPSPCPDCDVMHMVALVTAEAPAREVAEEAIFTVVSATEYGYWFVRVDGETEITFEDWSPATVEDISVDSMIDVVGPLWGGGYVGAQYIIILDPATNPPPVYDPANPVPSAYP
jgi:hypothetical protein